TPERRSDALAWSKLTDADLVRGCRRFDADGQRGQRTRLHIIHPWVPTEFLHGQRRCFVQRFCRDLDGVAETYRNPRTTLRNSGRFPPRHHSEQKANMVKRKLSVCTSCVRNSGGRIARSPAAKRAFRQANPCPATGERSG